MSDRDFWTAAAEAADRERENEKLRALLRDLTATLDRYVAEIGRVVTGEPQLDADRRLLERAKRVAFPDPSLPAATSSERPAHEGLLTNGAQAPAPANADLESGEMRAATGKGGTVPRAQRVASLDGNPAAGARARSPRSTSTPAPRSA